MQEEYTCKTKKGDFASPSAESHYRPDFQLEPVHEIINLTFAIKDSKCFGSVTQRVKANVATNTVLSLNALNFTISEVTSIDPATKKTFDITWHYDGSLISVSWKQSWSAEEVRDVIINYEVVKPIAGLYFSYPDDNQTDKPIYVGADHETEKARYWLPCIDHPSIRTTLEFFLTSDSSHTILANGKLVDEKVNGDKKTAHWILDFPCPSYLTTICIGDLVTYEDRDADAGKGPIQVKYFSSKRYSANDLKLSFDRTPKMLEWMNKKLGVPLPYPKYYQYALPHHGGAMENISLVSWDDFHVLDETGAKEFTWQVDQINVHEMAHSWFGDSVVIKDFAHAWMKESWATYMETVWLEENVSQEEADYDRFVNERRYRNETKRYVRPVVTNKYDSSWNMFDSHLYPGGAQRIDMVRKLVGDEAFWKGVNEYLVTYQRKIAETSDFQRMLEKHSGLNLQQFFDQWYYSKGFPILKITSKFDDKNKMLELKIKQAQVNKEKEIGLFKFILEVRLEIDEKTYLDYTFDISEEEHVFYAKLDKNPLQIIIDEKNKVLMDFEFNPGPEMLKRIITNGSMKNKIYAMTELSKKGTDDIVQFLADLYNQENFWGIKTEIISTLGSIYNVKSIDALLTIFRAEQDPMVIRTIIDTLKNGPLTEKVISEMKNYLATSEPLYFGFSGALQLLGSYREQQTEMLQFLKEFTTKVDKKGIIESGKRLAIGKLRTSEATEFLISEISRKDILSTNMSNVINALTDSVIWADKKDIDRVKEVLIDKVKTETIYQILRTLAYSLAKFEDPSLNKHITKIKSKIAFQEWPMIDRIVERNKGKSPNEELKNLEEKISKIEKENLEMKDKINKLEKLIEK